MRRPASLAPLAIAAAIVTGAAVGGIAWLTGGRAIMPGALHGVDPRGDAETHGGVRAHSEIDDCEACHPGFPSSETASDRCVACHDDIAAQLRDAAALHARLDARGHCLRCHTEHRGADGELTRIDRDHFQHDATGFSLAAHEKTRQGAPFPCSGCHPRDVDEFDAAECERCHRAEQAAFVTAHVAAWGTSCRACHDGVDRFGRGRFDHARTTFALAGKHVPVACEACHVGVRDLDGYARAPSRCDACHAKQDIHQGRLGADCARCHTAAGWSTIVAGAFDHGRTRFPLTGAHVKVACSSCHWHDRFAGTPRDCASCHPRPRDHFAGPCDRCHTTTGWRGARRPESREPAPPDEPSRPDTTTNASSRRP